MHDRSKNRQPGTQKAKPSCRPNNIFMGGAIINHRRCPGNWEAANAPAHAFTGGRNLVGVSTFTKASQVRRLDLGP
jgi:hypothetical protein